MPTFLYDLREIAASQGVLKCSCKWHHFNSGARIETHFETPIFMSFDLLAFAESMNIFICKLEKENFSKNCSCELALTERK